MRDPGPLRLGLLGAGMVARVAVGPAAAVAKGVTPVAAAARDPRRAAALVPGGRAYGRYEELLADPEVDAVYCSLANDAHHPWARAALRAGKHVLCEKPLALDAAQVADLTAEAARAGLLLVEASWYRWHPRTRAAEDLVAAGALGRVVGVDAGFTFAAAGPSGYRLDPAMGGGALYDVGCYCLSVAAWALGAAALHGVRVTALRRRSGPTGVDLATEAILDTGGATVHLDVALDRPERQWIEIRGTAGRLVFGSPAFTAWTGDDTGLTVSGGDGPGRDGSSRSWPPVDAYRLMLEAFADAARGGGAWVVPVSDSLAVAAALDTVRLAPASTGT